MAHRTRTTRLAPAMTLLETVIALAIISIVLGAFVAISESLVADSADKQTLRSLRTLGAALEIYKEGSESETYPSGLAEGDTEIDTPMARCIAKLRSFAPSAKILEEMPGQRTTRRGYYTFIDGYGNTIIYVNPADADRDPRTADWVRRFGRSIDNRPFFVSAGKDGNFGDLTEPDSARAVADNLDSL